MQGRVRNFVPDSARRSRWRLTVLESWNDTATRQAIVAFVESVGSIPPEERIAVFDNDGTLWCEKPLPIELAFILKRLAEMAERDESLRRRQPWQAAHDGDYAWLGNVITKHYQGDDSDVKVLLGGILQAFAGWTVDEYGAAAHAFVHDGEHPTLKRPLAACGYVPMVELLRYLEDNGFTCYIASGGDRDFMRPITGELYGIPPERVIGSSNGLRYDDDDPLGRLHRRAGRLRRRPGEAGADLEPDRPPSDPRRRQLERRHPHARVGRGVSPADPPRRPGAGVRLRGGRRGVPRAREGGRLDGRQREERLGDGVRRLTRSAAAELLIPFG